MEVKPGTVSAGDTVAVFNPRTGQIGADTGEFVFHPINGYFVLPVRVNQNVKINLRRLDTGETVYENELPGPLLAGQA